MDSKELSELIKSTVEEAVAPIQAKIEELTDKGKPGDPDPLDDLSPAAKQWIEDNKTGGLGGKDLNSATPHNPNPRSKQLPEDLLAGINTETPADKLA